MGLSAALNRRGYEVQAFKKGPDYIDPLWLQKATGNPCYNLDFNTMSDREIRTLFDQNMDVTTFGLIEGNKGLYDGVALDGHDSNAAMAVLLKAPVVLVIDVVGITRGIAPLLLGYKSFRPDVQISGVIFNKVASSRQEDKLRTSVEHYTDIAICGSVRRNKNLLAPERHLGLVPPDESDHAQDHIDELAQVMEDSLEMDHLIEISQQAHSAKSAVSNPQPGRRTPDVRIAIARDSAFGFYYADDLEALQQAGAELVYFNTLKDRTFPKVDGLFLGGGFPETHMKDLQDNSWLRCHIYKQAKDGLPIYAECGGMMYLAENIIWNGEVAQMVGFIPSSVVMHDKPQGRGLVRLQETGQGLWPKPKNNDQNAEIKAHEFHYASLEGLPDDTRFAYKVLRGTGIDGRHDGILLGNMQAGFCHHRTTKQNGWASRFVDFVRRCKRG